MQSHSGCTNGPHNSQQTCNTIDNLDYSMPYQKVPPIQVFLGKGSSMQQYSLSTHPVLRAWTAPVLSAAQGHSHPVVPIGPCPCLSSCRESTLCADSSDHVAGHTAPVWTQGLGLPPQQPWVQIWAAGKNWGIGTVRQDNATWTVRTPVKETRQYSYTVVVLPQPSAALQTTKDASRSTIKWQRPSTCHHSQVWAGPFLSETADETSPALWASPSGSHRTPLDLLL